MNSKLKLSSLILMLVLSTENLFPRIEIPFPDNARHNGTFRSLPIRVKTGYRMVRTEKFKPKVTPTSSKIGDK